MLHMEVFMQRLEQEYGAIEVTTTPTVTYILDFGQVWQAGSRIIRTWSGVKTMSLLVTSWNLGRYCTSGGGEGRRLASTKG